MSLSGANSIIMLGITGLYPTPQQLQGFAADNIFTAEMIKMVETLMGVDGILSGGFVNVEKKQTFELQGDSASNDIFDNWAAAQETLNDTYEANGVVTLTTLGKKWTMTTGFLTGYTYMPDVKKLIQPRKYEITWNKARVQPA